MILVCNFSVLRHFPQVCHHLGERSHRGFCCGAFSRKRGISGGLCNAVSCMARVIRLQGVTGGEAMNHISPNMVVQVNDMWLLWGVMPNAENFPLGWQRDAQD